MIRDEQIGQRHQAAAQGGSPLGSGDCTVCPRVGIDLLVIFVARGIRIDSHVPVLSHLAVEIDDAVVIVEQVRHEAIDIVGDHCLLGGIGGQVVIDGVAIQHRVEVVHADIAIEAIIREASLSLMPMAESPPPRSNAITGPWPFT